MKAKIGFLGLGKIGTAMASNIAKNGYKVHGFDLSSQQLQFARTVGIEPCQDIKELARNTQILFSVLPNDKITLDAFQSNQNELLRLLPKDTIHVCSATINPKTSELLSQIHLQFDHKYVAAPVFGRPDGMQRAESTILMSGDYESIQKLKPIFKTTSKSIYEFGDSPGAANVAKICGNFLIASSIEAMAEAFYLAQEHNIDPVLLKDMLSTSIFDCRIFKEYGKLIATKDHYPHPNAHFALELAHKDNNLALQIAKDVGIEMPYAELLNQRYTQATLKNRQKQDWSVIALETLENINKK